MSWEDKFAEDADNHKRCDLIEGRKLARQVAAESDSDLEFGAEMVLEHYRHPAEVTIGTLTSE